MEGGLYLQSNQEKELPAKESLETHPNENKEGSLELSQETIEKILEKTKDINADGTAFSVIGEYSAGWFTDEQERRKKDYLGRKKDEEQFKKELIKNNPTSWQVPLKPEYYSVNKLYETYCGIVNGEDDKDYKHYRIGSFGMGMMGLSSDKITPKEEFIEKYNIEIEKQKEKLELKLKEEYQEYLQNLEDKVHGQNFDRFKKEWLKKLFDYRSSRIDLLEYNQHQPDYYANQLFEKYLNLENLWYNNGYDEKTEARLKRMGLIEEFEGNSRIVGSLIVDKGEFTKRYMEALEKQNNELDIEAQGAYEKYNENFNESKYKEKKLGTIKSILKNGILGGRKWTDQDFLSMQPSDWAKDVRQKEKPRNVFFNIMGNFHNELTDAPKKSGYEMGDSFFFRKRNHSDQPNDGIAIIFDTKDINYQSDDPNFRNGYYQGKDLRRGTPDSQYGFAGPIRIAPRKFEGIVISCTDILKESGKYDTTVYSTDKEKWKQTAKDIAKSMIHVNKDNPERITPIYDVHGNMLWPVEMSKEEIIDKLNIIKETGKKV